ncbi:MAG: PD-(D/E)XK nuclease-like domain-containing protein [Planctomycetaceae bacterium]|nr:PD-(D/E)XK nuclease-like domain-containing protein [Planctomycetaceae bacterium]
MLHGTIRESDADYHAQSVFKGGAFLSSHALMEFIESPAAYHGKMIGTLPAKDSDAYRAGRAAHCRILEGRDAYRRRYTFGGPINEKTGKYYGQQTKAYEEWRVLQEADGREVLPDSTDTLCEFMAASVERHPEAMESLAEGEPEAVARAKYCGFDCQIKIDWLKPDAIVDLKTCRELRRFHYDFFSYRYPNQLSFYQKVFECFAGVRLPIYIIAVEKEAPYRSTLYQIEQGVLDKAQLENENAIHGLRECIRSGLWPTGYEGLHFIKAS